MSAIFGLALVGAAIAGQEVRPEKRGGFLCALTTVATEPKKRTFEFVIILPSLLGDTFDASKIRIRDDRSIIQGALFTKFDSAGYPKDVKAIARNGIGDTFFLMMAYSPSDHDYQVVIGKAIPTSQDKSEPEFRGLCTYFEDEDAYSVLLSPLKPDSK